MPGDGFGQQGMPAKGLVQPIRTDPQAMASGLSPERKNPPATCAEPDVEPKPGNCGDAKRKWGESFHAYGGKAALCFTECETRNGGKPTVMVEVARAANGGFDWASKTAVMFTVSELPLVLGFFTGELNALELKGHGAQKEKSVTFANQGNQFFISFIVRGQSPRAVPMQPKDSYPVIAMLLRQMLRVDTFLTASLVLQLSKNICGMHAAGRTGGGL